MSFFNRKEKSDTRKSISVGYVVLSCIVLAYFSFEAGKVSWGIGIIAFLLFYGGMKAVPTLSGIKKDRDRRKNEEPENDGFPQDVEMEYPPEYDDDEWHTDDIPKEDYDHTDETEETYRDMYGYDTEEE